jgi:hypothetical protein
MINVQARIAVDFKEVRLAVGVQQDVNAQNLRPAIHASMTKMKKKAKNAHGRFLISYEHL